MSLSWTLHASTAQARGVLDRTCLVPLAWPAQTHGFGQQVKQKGHGGRRVSQSHPAQRALEGAGSGWPYASLEGAGMLGWSTEGSRSWGSGSGHQGTGCTCDLDRVRDSGL